MEKEKVLVLMAMVLAGIGCVFSFGMLAASALNLFEVSSDLQVGFLATAIACFSTALTAVLANMRLQESYALTEEVFVLMRDVADLAKLVQRVPERRPAPVYQPEETYVDETEEPVIEPIPRRRINIEPPRQVYEKRHAQEEELPPVRVKRRPTQIVDEFEVDYSTADRFKETQQPMRRIKQPLQKTYEQPLQEYYEPPRRMLERNPLNEGNGQNVPVRPDKLPRLLQGPAREVQPDRPPVDLEQRRRDQQTQRRMMSPFDTRREQ